MQRSGCWREGVADDAAFRVLALAGDPRGQELRRRGGDDDVVGRGGVDPREQLDLEVLVVERALLDELGVGDCVLEVGGKAQPVAPRPRRETDLLEARPGDVDDMRQPGHGVGSRIRRDDVDAVGEKIGGPAAADRAGADAGDAFHVVGVGSCHDGLSYGCRSRLA